MSGGAVAEKTKWLVPGPTRIPDQVIQAHGSYLGSPDLEEEFFQDYVDSVKK